MPAEQFAQAVRGSGGQPVATNAQGTIETDNYPTGGAFDTSAYPHTVNPAETIQEVVITNSGDIVARITTSGGDVFDLPLASGSGSFDKWEIESVEFRDPNNTGAQIQGGWAGE